MIVQQSAKLPRLFHGDFAGLQAQGFAPNREVLLDVVPLSQHLRRMDLAVLAPMVFKP